VVQSALDSQVAALLLCLLALGADKSKYIEETLSVMLRGQKSRLHAAMSVSVCNYIPRSANAPTCAENQQLPCEDTRRAFSIKSSGAGDNRREVEPSRVIIKQ